MHEVSRSRIVKSVCSILHSGSHSIFPYRFGIDETDDDEQVEAFQSKSDDHPSISLKTHSFDWIEIQEAHCRSYTTGISKIHMREYDVK